MVLEILFDKRLKTFESPNTKVFEINGKPALFAMVCDKIYYPRFGIYDALSKGFKSSHLLVPLDMFSVSVPYDKANKKICFIFQKPEAPRLTEKTLLDIKIIKSLVIPSLINLLDELSSFEITHRAIRPNNIYLSPEEKIFMLQECISSPPGMFQPDVFEEIPRQMCSPFLRGDGDSSTDIYSLGILLIALITGKTPFQNLENKEIIKKKYEFGSFYCLVHNSDILSYNLKEVLQGCLHDEVNLRWTVKDLKDWHNGTIKIRNFIKKSLKTSPLILAETKITSVGQFLILVMLEWKGIAEKLDLKRIKDWVVKNFSDRNLLDKIENITALHKIKTSHGITTNELILMCLSFVLSSNGPFFWRKIAFMPESIAQLLLYFLFENKDIESFKTLVRTKILSHITSIFNLPEKHSFEILEHEISFNYNGLEYCLYRFNKFLPCMSDLIVGEIITKESDLIPALENNVDKIKTCEIIDSHILTYILKGKQVASSTQFNFKNINNINKQIKILMNLELASGKTQHVKLSQKILKYCEDFVHDYKNRHTREKLLKELEKKSNNSLTFKELYNIVNNIELLKEDRQNFAIARRTYREICARIIKITNLYLKNDSITVFFAEKITLFLSVLCASVIVFVIVNYSLFGES